MWPNDVALRTAVLGDEPFLESLYASARPVALGAVPWKEQQEGAFVPEQFRQQTAHCGTRYPGADRYIVTSRGEDVGFLSVLRGRSEWRLIDIALQPQCRGRGIGSALVRQLLQEGAAAGVPVTASVTHDNPARRLYERLGFRVAAVNEVYLLLKCSERTPHAARRHQDEHPWG